MVGNNQFAFVEYASQGVSLPVLVFSLLASLLASHVSQQLCLSKVHMLPDNNKLPLCECFVHWAR